MRVIRKTTTVCPDCVRELEGRVVVDAGEAFLERECPEHGVYRHPLSRHGEAYADFDRYYFLLMEEEAPKGRVTNFWVFLTPECQLNCAYCAAKTDPPFFHAMTLEQFRAAVAAAKGAKISLSGGEPTMHPQFFEFVAEARRQGVPVQLASNGVKLASREFCEGLVNAGVAEVRMSVDSLNADDFPQMAKPELHAAKLEALESLEAVGLTTTISPTIFKGKNEDQLIAALEYAKDRPFVRSLSVNGFAWNAEGTKLDRAQMIMPDEMMDVLMERYYAGDREDAYVLQKVLLALMRILQIRLCSDPPVHVHADHDLRARERRPRHDHGLPQHARTRQGHPGMGALRAIAALAASLGDCAGARHGPAPAHPAPRVVLRATLPRQPLPDPHQQVPRQAAARRAQHQLHRAQRRSGREPAMHERHPLLPGRGSRPVLQHTHLAEERKGHARDKPGSGRRIGLIGPIGSAASSKAFLVCPCQFVVFNRDCPKRVRERVDCP